MIWQLIVLLAVMGIYFIAMNRWADRLAPSVQRRHLLWFTIGLVAALVAFIPSPNLFGANYRFMANMVEFFLLTGLAAPLLLLGIPRTTIHLPAALDRATRWLKSPLRAYLVANFVFLAWHVPIAFETASRDPIIWSIKQVILLGAGLIAWAPVFEGESLWGKNFHPLRLLYLFFLSIPTTVLGALFTLAPNLVYSARALAFEICAPAFLGDQQAGGLVMWYAGAIIDLFALSILFFRWFGTSDAEA
jgi:cytochrome c oxidase assembly factor CtaG